jgi:hypothetical protein
MRLCLLYLFDLTVFAISLYDTKIYKEPIDKVSHLGPMQLRIKIFLSIPR